MSRRTHGYVALRYADGSSLTFAAHERERLVTAWRDGARYFEGMDEYGGEAMCLLEGVRAVCYFSPSALAACREEEHLDRFDGAL